jgi:hypothetical protein
VDLPNGTDDFRIYGDGELLLSRAAWAAIREDEHPPRDSDLRGPLYRFGDEGGCVVSDEPSVAPKKKYLPQTGSVCPYKAKVIDEILERELRGEPIISPRPEPRPTATDVDGVGFMYRGRPGRLPILSYILR